MEDFETDQHDGRDGRSSIAAPLLRALLFAALAFGIYALIFGDLGGMSETELGDAAANPTAAATVAEVPAPTPDPLAPDPMATATDAFATEPAAGDPLATPGGTESTGLGGSEAPAGQIGAGVTAQVIAGAGTSAEQFAAAAAALRELGYEVTESGTSPNAYAQTTVFATAGEEAQAEALVAADDRFAVVGDNPGNLRDSIQIHVLVGEDFPTS
jgi:hypothetical protein